MQEYRAKRQFLAQVVLPVAIALSLTAAVLALLLAWSTHAVDEAARQRQAGLFAVVLHDSIRAVAHDQEASTVWDDAVVQVRRAPLDRDWLDANLGVWMHSYYGHDQTYVVDPRGRPVYAMQDGRRTAPSRYAVAEPTAGPLMMRLRAEMRDPVPRRDTTVLSDGASDLGMVAGRPAIVSVKPIVSDTGRIRQAAGSEFLHVSVRFLDRSFLTRLAGAYWFRDVRFAPPGELRPGEIGVPLRSADGVLLGRIAWRPFEPGARVLGRLAPGLALGLMLIGGVLGWLMLRLRRGTAQLQLSRARAEHLAFHDSLTGLPNRALFENRLDQALAGVRRGAGRAALLYLDLDRFKNVNDTLGHPAGDDLIRQLGRRLAMLVRESDTVARLGGDEFAILQTGVGSPADIEILCLRIIEAVDAPFEVLGGQAHVGISIGVALAPVHSVERVELSRKADIALYHAKSHGRGRFTVFAEEMDSTLRSRRSLEQDLRAALAGDQLAVHYQPQFAMRGGAMTGVEALVRWHHPAKGMMPPAAFLPVAEESGLIEAIGEWVLREATRAARDWPVGRLSINVSALQLRRPGFAARVMALLAESGFEPARLQLEIGESRYIEHAQDCRPNIMLLRANGVQMALDDFGTGFSSLGSLRQCAIDRVKIDRSFVQAIDRDADGDAVIAAIIRLAQATGLHVTAGGVETAGQNAALATMGCDEVQGFLLARPLPAAAIARLLADGGGPGLLPAPARTVWHGV
ncbi:putative bifunctional diguanylate cyclase/phosphodiesterase [Sphingomonas solaris]|uniref:putative bifunctional diguanylate cyclase/phosphodiesterase n=1 Tax=Alterirhizorhabdus solaris TaxID=2529389 RepID=UPI001EF08AD5|nr:EAL domain-containing protein [Sphingomonas solaris]